MKNTKDYLPLTGGILLIGSVLAVGLWLVVIRPLGPGMSLIPGDLGDARLVNYVLENFYQWTLGRVPHFWDAPFFYPYPRMIAFSDSMLGSAPFYALFRRLGLDSASSFQAWYVFGYVLNYVAAAYALSRLKLSPIAVATGAFFFTFGLPIIAQENHPQLLYRLSVPLACTLLWLFSHQPRLRMLVAILFWLVWQFYLSIYIGYFLALLLLAMIVVLPLRMSGLRVLDRLKFWPHQLRCAWAATYPSNRFFAIITGTGFVAALGALFLPYYWVSRAYGLARSWDEIASMLPRIQSYFLADKSQLWAASMDIFAQLPMRHEHQLFSGVAVLLLLLLGIVWRFDSEKRKVAFLMLWAQLVLVVFTLSIDGHSLYWITSYLPGVGSIRGVARIQLVLMWPLALFSACVLDALIKTEDYRFNSTALACLMAAFVIAEPVLCVHHTYPKSEGQARLAELRAQLPASLADDAVLFVAAKDGEAWLYRELDAMLLTQELGLPTLNGYSSDVPGAFLASNSCTRVSKQLRQYMIFAGAEESFYRETKKRVVPIGFKQCDF